MVRTNFLRISTALLAMMAAALVAYAPAEATTAQDTLKQPPFAPTDTSLFSPGVYSDAPELQSPSSGPTDEATLRGMLSDLLEQRFPNSPKTVKQALAVFDSDKAKQIVPDPRLRAALVALKGTAGEAAIGGTLDGTYSTLEFGTPPDSDAVAQVHEVNGSRKITFNQEYQFEDFRLLSSTLSHEPLHRDSAVSNKEELVAEASSNNMVYGQFLLENPELAVSGTRLAQSNNTDLMARINSRDTNGNLRLFTATGNIFPNSTVFVRYFAAPFEPLGNDTPGNKVLKGELTQVVGKGVKVPKKPNFDDNTLLLLDSHEGLLSPEQIVQLAGILKLDTSPPSSMAMAQRAQQEATASNQPTLDWREIFGDK